MRQTLTNNNFTSQLFTCVNLVFIFDVILHVLINIFSFFTQQENAMNPQSPGNIVTSPTQERPVSLLQSNVEKLAAALSNRVTIKVNPENGSR